MALQQIHFHPQSACCMQHALPLRCGERPSVNYTSPWVSSCPLGPLRYNSLDKVWPHLLCCRVTSPSPCLHWHAEEKWHTPAPPVTVKLSNSNTCTHSYVLTHRTQNRDGHLSCERLSQQPCFHIISSLPSLGHEITRESLLASVCFPIPPQRWGSPPPWEPVGSFNPPVRQYQTDVSIKEEPIYKSQLVCWIRGSPSKEDTREEGPGQEPPILQEAASLRACPSTARHKRAFLPSTSPHHCPTLLP